MKTKRLLTLLLLVCGMTTGAWALNQDNEGYYLLGSLQDWQDFAALVQNTPTANARMIADIDLGDDQTKIGDDAAYTNPSTQNANNPFKGVFDGQGHTLTVKYTTATGKFPSPFPNINGATIKNLHVAGSIVSTTAHAGGVVSASWGTDHLENVWVSATISSTGQSWDECGAIVACMKKGTLTLNDCMFTGDMTSTQSYNGCFVGYCNAGTTTITNCLSTGTFAYSGSSMSYGAITHNNCYVKQFPSEIPSKMLVTDPQLADGTIAYKLQNNRTELFWGQRIGIDERPVLTNDESYRVYRGKNGYTNSPEDSYTGLQQDADGYYLLDGKMAWLDFAALVNGGTYNAKAKMTADIDLGDDQTTVGTMETPFQGVFDGQGHTLTIDFTPAEERFGLFRFISGATIRNLNVTGTINTTYRMVGSLVGRTDGGINNITNCRSSVDINSTTNEGHQTGGLVGRVSADVTLNISDCVFDGSIVGQYYSNYCGGIVGYNVGTLNMSNCLFMPETAEIGSSNTSTLVQDGGTTNISNCYYTTAMGTVQGTLATTITLSNGTITAALQNGRAGLVWGQRIGTDAEPVLTNDESYRVYRSINGGYTNDPTLAYEGLQKDVNDNYLLGCVWDWKEFAEIVNSGTNNTANAKMTADIDLGDDQTMIGTNSNRYKGTFDGDGHTLTVNIVSGNIQFIAPFRYVQGGTIRNLRVNGTIASSGNHSSGLIGRAYDKINIEKCIVAANIQMSSDYAGGFVGNGGSKQYGGASQVVMRNCLFAGTFTGITYSRSKAAGFWGWGASTPAFINCLENGIYTNIAEYNPFMYEGTDNENIETTSNSYYKHGIISLGGISNATAMTDEQIVNNLGEEWVQDVLTNQPQLAIFANKYTVPSSGIGTFSAKAKFAVPEGLTAHYCKTYNSAAGTVSVAKIDGAVPANTGVLLRGTPGETYTLTGTNSEAATVTDNALVAVTEETSIAQESGDYVNFGLSGGVFKKVNVAGGTVKANRAYLHILKSSLPTGAKSIALAWDGETTGIANLNVDANDNFDANAPMYNLAGQRVGKSYKGIVVVNGKKVLIK